MVKHLLLISLSLLILTNCELSDKIQREADRIKNQYEEYVGDKETRGERPFEVVYQQDEKAITPIFTSSCSANQVPKSVYFATPDEAEQQYYNAVRNLVSSPASATLKPYWDIRYINPVTSYIQNQDASHYPNHAQYTGLDARSGQNHTTTGTSFSQTDASGGVVQSKCVDNQIVAGTTINLFDAPEQILTYAGPTQTFIYNFNINSHIRPWKTGGNGNLMMQASFDTPIYFNYGGNYGGSISFGLFIHNRRTGKFLNYIIGIYAAGQAWQKEKAGIRFDPTTNIVHVATVMSENSWWSTISPKSNSIQEVFSIANKTTSDDGEWNNFFRANISYQNLLAVLNELKKNPPEAVAGEDFGLSPEDWDITSVMIQFELEEEAGKATLSGSFKGFDAYISNLPL